MAKEIQFNKAETLSKQEFLASSEIKEVVTQISYVQKNKIETDLRLNLPEVKLTIGKSRSIVQDSLTVIANNKIAESIKSVELSIQNVSKRNLTEISLASQKLQRTCNHSYSLFNNRCVFCNKSRQSHVYDAAPLTIHNSR